MLADDPASLGRLVGVVRGLTHRWGSAVLAGLADHPELADALHAHKESLVCSGTYARWGHIHRTAEGEPIARPTLDRLALAALCGSLFLPNLVPVDAATFDDTELAALAAACEDH